MSGDRWLLAWLFLSLDSPWQYDTASEKQRLTLNRMMTTSKLDFVVDCVDSQECISVDDDGGRDGDPRRDDQAIAREVFDTSDRSNLEVLSCHTNEDDERLYGLDGEGVCDGDFASLLVCELELV